ncbi:FAD-dependent oxidoreductase [Pontiella agarivorans]|uniref:FAD-dependent oxidoreductase n=1 Tax=Pontiella agarivorans TaxID=3038953 RepID=A0ABU5MS75_9BACT|nr:FAD-dependent oxidoreductase [Pontiella agarivorans]MDZ8117057.1 FAD-dependent oxidoreductase [Pontiella agarivorans]
MNRRDMFKSSAVAASMVPIIGKASEDSGNPEERTTDNWFQVGTGQRGLPDRKETLTFDVAVLGGGIAGICAAVSAARNGAKTVLVQDRPVLGGNASSEMRVHLNGVTHLKPDNRAERETGVIEELLLHNRFNNKQESWPVWDHLLYDFVISEPNLELILNTQATEAVMNGSTIVAAKCWQLTTETQITIRAAQFIDCSGDGLLAATAGALYRSGREGKKEFGERYAPDEPDGWQMGATLLMHSEDMGKPMPFQAPSWAIPYEAEKSHPKRKFKGFQNGIWWMEVGSDGDIIGEQEEIRHKLMCYAYGVWDYIKNSGKVPEAENHALTWVQSLPGKRESRRFIGDYILHEGDLLNHTHFEDAVGYGGWSLDEHNPGGIENLKEPPSYFHEHFHKVYEIPYRSLYSKNITNLSFAGRNISQTHIALSSTRLMATCATMGMAVGTAAALCIQKKCNPRDIATRHINELQEQLLRDDAFIPHRPANDSRDLARKADLIAASSSVSGDAKLLTDGWSRDFEGVEHGWESHGLPAEVLLEWEEPVTLSRVEIKCDTNVKRNIMMRKDSMVSKNFWNDVPVELLKSLDVEARVNGQWVSVGSNDDNRKRLIKFNFDPIRTSGIRINLKETYGAVNAKLFEVRCYET